MFDRPERRNMNSKVRAYGKARIDIARRAHNRADWDTLWKKPQFGYPFRWGENWKQCVEYRVDDFAAEVGFYIDVLGLPVNAFDPNYAMFTSPDQAFYLTVVPNLESEPSTPFDAVRFQFMVTDLFPLAEELEKRGIVFEQYPQPVSESSNLYIGSFRTPHGILIEIWGLVEEMEETLPEELATEENLAGPSIAAEVEEMEHEEEEEAPASKPQPAQINQKPEPIRTLAKELKYEPEDLTEPDSLEPRYIDTDEEPERHYRPIPLRK